MPKTQADVSQELLDLLKKHEGYHPSPYDDGAGNLTIGYGHRITDSNWKQFDSDKDGKLDEHEATALLQLDASKHQKFKKKLTVDVAPEVETALGSLEYNLGSNNKNLKNIIGAINEGQDALQISGLIQELTKAKNKQTGEVVTLRGLEPRRRDEAKLIETGLNPQAQEQQLPAQHTPRQQRGLFDRVVGEILPQAAAEEPNMGKLTPAEQQELDQLNRLAGGNSAPSLTPAEQQELDQLNQSTVAQPGPGDSPELPAEAKNLSFATKVKLALAEDPASREEVLKAEYGEKDVMTNPMGELLVKENGKWVKADSSFLAEMTAALPEIGGAIAGRAAGAAMGAAVAGPVGAVVGGVLGGGAISALAGVVKDKGAELAGLKTEYDAKQAADAFTKEFAINLAIDGALGTVGYAWRGLGKPLLKVAGHSAGTMKAIASGDKPIQAQLLSKLMNGTHEADWATVIRNADNAMAFTKDLNDYHAWERVAAEGAGAVDAVDPLTKKMTRIAVGALRGAKQRASAAYNVAWDGLEESGALTQPVSITKAGATFRTALADLGILGKDPKTGAFLIKKTPDTESIMQVFDPKSLGTLNRVLQQVSATGEKITAADAKKVLKGIDDILESSGFYNTGNLEISKNARRVLMELRTNVNDAFVAGLKEKSPEAALKYQAAAAKYAKFRSVYDDFAPVADNPQRLQQTIDKMLGDKGMQLESQFSSLLKNVGIDDSKIITRMQQLRAARNLSGQFSPSSSGIGTIIKGAIGVGNPQAVGKYLAERTIENAAKIAQKATPMTSESATQAVAAANAVDFVKKLSPAQKSALLSNAQLMQNFVGTVVSAPGVQRETLKTLFQGPAVGPVE